MPFQAICPDGWVRNTSGKFDTLAEADRWAQWGHACTRGHVLAKTGIQFETLDAAQRCYSAYSAEWDTQRHTVKTAKWSFLRWMDNLGHSYPNRSI